MKTIRNKQYRSFLSGKSISALIILMFAVSLTDTSCKKTEKVNTVSETPADGRLITNANPDYTATVTSTSNNGQVNGNIIGFNAEYDQETDANWNSGLGNIPTTSDQMAPALYRWPGGTVTTFYHWANQTGSVNGHKDSLDPTYPGGITPASGYMSVDEYLAMVVHYGYLPVIGVNMSSGEESYSTRAAGITEAKGLVTHVRTYLSSHGMSGATVYYYLDNEPYDPGCNHIYPNGTVYADVVAAYAPALRGVDSNIKIIAESQNDPVAHQWTKDLLAELSTKTVTVDFVDVHYYWRFNGVSFDAWRNDEPIMQNRQTAVGNKSRPFSAERTVFSGLPHAGSTELAALEWDLGKKDTSISPPSEAEDALMISEMYMQFIQSGLQLASFWPIDWPSLPSWNRSVWENISGTYSTNKIFDMFKQFSFIPNKIILTSSVSAASGSDDSDRIRILAVKTTGSGNVINIMLVNKDQNKASANVKISLPSYAFTGQSAVGFNSTDTGHGSLTINTITPSGIVHSGTTNQLTIAMPKNSFAKVTVSR